VLVKPKRHVRINNTSIPPIPLLFNLVLQAFGHEPSGKCIFGATYLSRRSFESTSKKRKQQQQKTPSFKKSVRRVFDDIETPWLTDEFLYFQTC